MAEDEGRDQELRREGFEAREKQKDLLKVLHKNMDTTCASDPTLGPSLAAGASSPTLTHLPEEGWSKPRSGIYTLRSESSAS